jgi:hypothetical protein
MEIARFSSSLYFEFALSPLNMPKVKKPYTAIEIIPETANIMYHLPEGNCKLSVRGPRALKHGGVGQDITVTLYASDRAMWPEFARTLVEEFERTIVPQYAAVDQALRDEHEVKDQR